MNENASLLAWNISKSVSTFGLLARKHRFELAELESIGVGEPILTNLRSLAQQIDDGARRAEKQWERIKHVIDQREPSMIEPTDSGVSIIHNHGLDADLCRTIRGLWESNGQPSVWELSERFDRSVVTATGLRKRTFDLKAGEIGASNQ